MFRFGNTSITSEFGKKEPGTLVRAVVLAAFVSLALAGLTSQANATTFPSHAPNVVDCSPGSIVAHASRQMVSWFGGSERVEWSSTLQSYGNGWYDYDPSQPYFAATANAYGLRALFYGSGMAYTWFKLNSDDSLGVAVSPSVQRYSNLPSGYYRIVNFYYWASTKLETWDFANTYNGVSAPYCHI